MSNICRNRPGYGASGRHSPPDDAVAASARQKLGNAHGRTENAQSATLLRGRSAGVAEVQRGVFTHLPYPMETQRTSRRFVDRAHPGRYVDGRKVRRIAKEKLPGETVPYPLLPTPEAAGATNSQTSPMGVLVKGGTVYRTGQWMSPHEKEQPTQ